MKKKDYILFAFVILSIIITSIFIYTRPIQEEAYVQIRIDNKIYATYSLETDQIIPINDTNTCIIKDHKVSMSEANCPDQICVHSKAIDAHGGTIICLPNHIIIEIITNKQDFDTIT